ncbi:hypothetical protein [Streptomyces sp. B1I3]|uniref:hypothetical protein n=1 Tax=Streptomyces sp. B1I3 TaxID=3042264 RepID=UPI002785AA6B|nr:hypothetical protein [Streptomyces sp. B1I3]MDQ0794502.1 hypothetical protein [Streptomyces sp. B1I3]
MPATEREAQPRSPQAEPPSPSAVSMRDLLASCAAASAVSTPPGEADPRGGHGQEDEHEDDGRGHLSAGRDAA